MASMQLDPRVRGELDGHELLAILAAIHDRYEACHPEARSEARRIFAAKLGDIACLLAGTNRRVALRAFGRASRFHVRAASAFATRFAAHLALGDR